jgi:ABC-2 type transport system ATP-binding protein
VTVLAEPPSTATAPAVAGRHLTKRLGGRSVLDGIDLVITSGELVVLLGPNGAGKSTLVHLLLGLRRPDHGELRIFGHAAGAPAARRMVGCAPQELSFPDTLRVGELVELATSRSGVRAGVDEVLDRFDLRPLARRQAGGLSGGERRRVAMALALAGAPALAVLDEPTVGLDVGARRKLWQTLRRYHERGGTVLLTTHDLDEAAALATRILVVDRGRLVRDGTPDQIRAAVPTAVVSFRCAGPSRWSEWPEVARVHLEGARRAPFGADDVRVQLLTVRPDALVRRLVGEQVPFHDLRVVPASLEEAFLAIVEDRS